MKKYNKPKLKHKRRFKKLSNNFFLLNNKIIYYNIQNVDDVKNIVIPCVQQILVNWKHENETNKKLVLHILANCQYIDCIVSQINIDLLSPHMKELIMLNSFFRGKLP